MKNTIRMLFTAGVLFFAGGAPLFPSLSWGEPIRLQSPPCEKSDDAILMDPQPSPQIWEKVLDLVEWEGPRPLPLPIFVGTFPPPLDSRIPPTFGCWDQKRNVYQFAQEALTLPHHQLVYHIFHEESHWALVAKSLSLEQHHCWMEDQKWASKIIGAIRELGIEFPEKDVKRAEKMEERLCEYF